jgi:hypothetical protein
MPFERTTGSAKDDTMLAIAIGAAIAQTVREDKALIKAVAAGADGAGKIGEALKTREVNPKTLAHNKSKRSSPSSSASVSQRSTPPRAGSPTNLGLGE